MSEQSSSEATLFQFFQNGGHLQLLKTAKILSRQRLTNYEMDFTVYGSLPKTSNTLNSRTPKIIAKNNFKMFS